MTSRGLAFVAVGLLAAGGAAAWIQRSRAPETRAVEPPRVTSEAERLREYLFALLQPVVLANCQLKRFGEPNDGGYLMCANLLDAVESGYSYGISGYDGWGCDISRAAHVVVHQYDCFDHTRPVCSTGRTIFHPECVGPAAETRDGRRFDTIAHQLDKNGDANRRVVMKMDVEGAEWDSLLSTPAEVLDRIDQLSIELHGIADEKVMLTILRLKDFFHVVNLHFNNWACKPGLAPFPADVFEVLFVSKRIGVVDARATARRPHPLDAPNNPRFPDCQERRGGTTVAQ